MPVFDTDKRTIEGAAKRLPTAFDFDKRVIGGASNQLPTAFDFDRPGSRRSAQIRLPPAYRENVSRTISWMRSREQTLIVLGGLVAVVPAASIGLALVNGTVLSPLPVATEYIQAIESGSPSAAAELSVPAALDADLQFFTDDFYGRVDNRPSDLRVDSYSIDGDAAQLMVSGSQGGEPFTTTLTARNEKRLGLLNHWLIEPMVSRITVPEVLAGAPGNESPLALNESSLTLNDDSFTVLPGEYTLGPAATMADTLEGEVTIVATPGQDVSAQSLEDVVAVFRPTDTATEQLTVEARDRVATCMSSTAVAVPECLIEHTVDLADVTGISRSLTGEPGVSVYLQSMRSVVVFVRAGFDTTYTRDVPPSAWGAWGAAETTVPEGTEFEMVYRITPAGELQLMQTREPLVID